MLGRVFFQKLNGAIFTNGGALPSPLDVAVENHAGALWFAAKAVYVVRFVSETEAEVVLSCVGFDDDELTEVLRRAMARFRGLG